MNLIILFMYLALIGEAFSRGPSEKVKMISLDATNLTLHWTSFKKNFLRTFKNKSEDTKRF